jgi:phosphoserine phosphatase RsbX
MGPMMHAGSQEHQLVEYGVAMQAHPGELVMGDAYLVRQVPHGVLVAVVDGLGHGQEAAMAANIAVTTLAAYAHEDVVALVQRCHAALKGTRGVVMSLASLYAHVDSMVWVGVGNIAGVLLSLEAYGGQRQALLQVRSGIVGYQLPRLHATVVPIGRGDTLILATDGIRNGFTTRVHLHQPVQHIAADILAQFNKGTDDASALAVRWRGENTAGTALSAQT